jgi:hypothetical protein
MAECDKRFQKELEKMRQQFKKDLADGLRDLNHQLYLSRCEVRDLEVAKKDREAKSAHMFEKEVVEARSLVSAEVREIRESAYQKVQTLKLQHIEQLKAKDAEISQLKEDLKEARLRLCSLSRELKSAKAERKKAKTSASMQKYHSGLLKYSKHKTCFTWAEQDDEEESSYERDNEGQDWEEGDELFDSDESEDMAVSENESERGGEAAPVPAGGAGATAGKTRAVAGSGGGGGRRGGMNRRAGSISDRRRVQSFENNNKRAIKRRGKKILCLLHKLSNSGDGRLAIKVLRETLGHHKVKGLLYKAGGVEALLGVARASNRYVVCSYVCA